MQKNFSMGAMGAEVILGDSRIDVHNLYHATAISTDLAGDTITFLFGRDHQLDGPPGLPEQVTLKCTGDLKIAFNDLIDAPVPLRQDAVEIAYYDSNCPWGHFLDEQLAETQGFDGLQVSFTGGLMLRIQCAVAEVTTG
jgi:hypothetical protein